MREVSQLLVSVVRYHLLPIHCCVGAGFEISMYGFDINISRINVTFHVDHMELSVENPSELWLSAVGKSRYFKFVCW